MKLKLNNNVSIDLPMQYGEKYGYADFFKNKFGGELKKFKDALYQKLLKSHGNVFRALDALSKDIDGLKIEKLYKPTPTFEPRFDPREPIQLRENAMGLGERQILVALAQQPGGMTREHLTVQTGYKRSTRDAYVQRLAQKQYVDGGKLVRATKYGIEALGNDYEPLPVGPELFAYHLKNLPEGEAKILQFLKDFDEGVEREHISESTGFKRSTRDAYIQRLALRQLVKIEGPTVKISDHLV